MLLSLVVAGLGACSDAGTPGTASDDSTGSTSMSATTTSVAPTTTTMEPTTDATVTDGSATGNSGTDPTDPTDPTTDSSSGGDPLCGDGNTDPGEECDDGNQDDTDACTSACKNAICGDAIVGPGEACDDGNLVDDDACSNTCALLSCGDGALQMGEECDDGDQDDTDECLSSCLIAKCGDSFVQAGTEECDDGNDDDTDDCVTGCKAASCGDSFVQAGTEECDDGNADDTDDCVQDCKAAECGDGFVQGGTEECDDGNASEADMCTTMCKAPTCEDGAKNGEETDVDCGAACSKCEAGEACIDGGDCGTGFCAAEVCTIAPSCKAIKQADPLAASGVYSLDPDGDGPVVAFDAFCEMTIDGGGWTLALKADGSKLNFGYANARWTDTSVFQPEFPDLDRNEAKLQSFNTVPFTDVLIGLESPILAMGALNLKTQKLPVTRPSLQNLFNGNVYTATVIGRPAWKALVTNSSLQPNCNREGFNVLGRSRIGIVSNQENDCNTPDSYIGFGNLGAGCNGVQETRVGNMASCAPDNGDKTLPAFGVVFVR